MSKKTYLMQTR